MITHAEKINVLNYNENKVSVMVSPTESFTFEPSVDGEIPSVIPMTFEQIRYANNYNTFRGGFLFFDINREKEIYEELGIINWEEILNNKEIQEILLNPSYEGLKKIVDNEPPRSRATGYQTPSFSLACYAASCGELNPKRLNPKRLKAEGTNDISVRVQQIINTRYKELQNKKVTTSIVLEKKDIVQPVPNKEVESLKAENKAMQEQLTNMQAMMEKLLAQQSAKTETNKPKKESATPKKSPGRPRKNAG